MHHVFDTSKSRRPRIQVFRDLDLAQKVGNLPDCSLVGVREVAALTGIAPSSFKKLAQRKKMNMPAQSLLGGRHLAWNLGDIRTWLNGSRSDDGDAPALNERRRPGRPKKTDSVLRPPQTKRHERANTCSSQAAIQNLENGAL